MLMATDRDHGEEIERLRAALREAMCPGGGYTGQPKDEEPTVGNCVKAGVCWCVLGELLLGIEEVKNDADENRP